jgi:hypothetical protein
MLEEEGTEGGVVGGNEDLQLLLLMCLCVVTEWGTGVRTCVRAPPSPAIDGRSLTHHPIPPPLFPRPLPHQRSPQPP